MYRILFHRINQFNLLFQCLYHNQDWNSKHNKRKSGACCWHPDGSSSAGMGMVGTKLHRSQQSALETKTDGVLSALNQVLAAGQGRGCFPSALPHLECWVQFCPPGQERPGQTWGSPAKVQKGPSNSPMRKSSKKSGTVQPGEGEEAQRDFINVFKKTNQKNPQCQREDTEVMGSPPCRSLKATYCGCPYWSRSATVSQRSLL